MRDFSRGIEWLSINQATTRAQWSLEQAIAGYARQDVRGIAISLVLLLHFHLSYSLLDSPLAAVLPVVFIKSVAVNCNYGVTMFFVVSGYLITSTTLKRYGSLGNVDVRGFYAFRFARVPGFSKELAQKVYEFYR